MGTHKDFLKGAVVLSCAVMVALMNGTFDVLVAAAIALVIHGHIPPNKMGKLSLAAIVCPDMFGLYATAYQHH